MSPKSSSPWNPSLPSWLKSGVWGLLCLNVMAWWLKTIALPLSWNQASFLLLIAVGLLLLVPLIAIFHASWTMAIALISKRRQGSRSWQAALEVWAISVLPAVLLIVGMLLLIPDSPSVPFPLPFLYIYVTAILYEMRRKQSGTPD